MRWRAEEEAHSLAARVAVPRPGGSCIYVASPLALRPRNTEQMRGCSPAGGDGADVRLEARRHRADVGHLCDGGRRVRHLPQRPRTVALDDAAGAGGACAVPRPPLSPPSSLIISRACSPVDSVRAGCPCQVDTWYHEHLEEVLAGADVVMANIGRHYSFLKGKKHYNSSMEVLAGCASPPRRDCDAAAGTQRDAALTPASPPLLRRAGASAR